MSKITQQQRDRYNQYKRERYYLLKTDPNWIIQERERNRNRMYEKRQRLEVRKLEYKRHTEWARRNKESVNASQRLRNQIPHYKLQARRNVLKRNYGLTYEQYIDMLETQHGLCLICGITLTFDQKKSKAAVDHDHKTGRVRGILCNSCNLTIGTVEKNMVIMRRMFEYLGKSI